MHYKIYQNRVSHTNAIMIIIIKLLLGLCCHDIGFKIFIMITIICSLLLLLLFSVMISLLQSHEKMQNLLSFELEDI